VVRWDSDDHQLRAVVVASCAAGTEPGRGADVLGGRVVQHRLDAGPSARETDRRAEQAGPDHLDRTGQRLTHRRAPRGYA
jgi:hypothetical protein